MRKDMRAPARAIYDISMGRGGPHLVPARVGGSRRTAAALERCPPQRHVERMPLDGPPFDLVQSSDAPGSAAALPPRDAALLDAYSHAVTGAVARVAPAVAHVRVERSRGRGAERQGSG